VLRPISFAIALLVVPQARGSIYGKVTDVYGGVIPGVVVSATLNGKPATATRL